MRWDLTRKINAVVVAYLQSNVPSSLRVLPRGLAALTYPCASVGCMGFRPSSDSALPNEYVKGQLAVKIITERAPEKAPDGSDIKSAMDLNDEAVAAVMDAMHVDGLAERLNQMEGRDGVVFSTMYFTEFQAAVPTGPDSTQIAAHLIFDYEATATGTPGG